MFIHLCITLAGVKKRYREVSVELPEGSTVEHALTAYAKMYPAPYNMNNMRDIIILRNKAVAWFGDILADGDEVTLLRVFAGG